MKKLIIATAVLVILVLAWYMYSHHTTSETVDVAPATTRPDASNATFLFEDGPVSLVKGLSDATDGVVTTETSLAKDVAYGDINGDGKTDAAVFLIQSGAGSGVFVYIAGYISGNVNYKGTNAVFIGDRVIPESINVSKDGTLTALYLDRKPSEPFAAEPTVLTSKSYAYANGELVEK